MPHLTAIIDHRGPIVAVAVGVSTQRASALKDAGLPIPAPITCNLLVDTGASHTCIDSKIIKPLGITPTGTVGVHTPSTGDVPAEHNTYDIAIVIPGSGPPKILGALPVSECSFSAQAIDGLLGRDVLTHARLTYSGPDNLIMISII